jgi:predicted Zn-dependent peptidase
VGTILGGLSMSALSGASTYAVGQVVISHLETGDGFLDVDIDAAKSAYQDAFEKGKEFVSDLKDQENTGKDVFKALQELGKLRDDGVITEEEFEAQKQKLLDRL